MCSRGYLDTSVLSIPVSVSNNYITDICLTRAYKAHTLRASAFNCVDSGAHELPKTIQLQCIL